MRCGRSVRPRDSKADAKEACRVARIILQVMVSVAGCSIVSPARRRYFVSERQKRIDQRSRGARADHARRGMRKRRRRIEIDGGGGDWAVIDGRHNRQHLSRGEASRAPPQGAAASLARLARDSAPTLFAPATRRSGGAPESRRRRSPPRSVACPPRLGWATPKPN